MLRVIETRETITRDAAKEIVDFSPSFHCKSTQSLRVIWPLQSIVFISSTAKWDFPSINREFIEIIRWRTHFTEEDYWKFHFVYLRSILHKAKEIWTRMWILNEVLWGRVSPFVQGQSTVLYKKCFWIIWPTNIENIKRIKETI